MRHNQSLERAPEADVRGAKIVAVVIGIDFTADQ